MGRLQITYSSMENLKLETDTIGFWNTD